MPIGGLGAGCLSLNGQGGLQDFSIRNRPNFTAQPDGHGYTDSAFAVLRVGGAEPLALLVEGPMPPEKIYDQGLQAQGFRKGGHEGLPRFAKAVFTNEFPFGHVDLSDPRLPLRVRLTAWNPFVPLDDKNSGLPCAILEYRLTNASRKTVDYEFSYHLSHLAGKKEELGRNDLIPGRGVYFHNKEPETSADFGSAALVCLDGEPLIRGMWLRGPGWAYESISALWREVSEGRFQPNAGSGDRGLSGKNGGSVLLKGRVKAGASALHKILVTWHFPNSDVEAGVTEENKGKAWQPWYSTQWKDARDVAIYVGEHYGELRSKTRAFREALASSSLPAEVLDAVASNLAILKSPTVLRMASGHLWGWEGCFASSGCCSGSCTHVWNYAQAFPNLYPSLERTLRDLELVQSMDAAGHVTFRAALPLGPTGHGFHAAADGQCGGILKLYRDWQISGDRAWLEKMYPHARRSLDFCIATWDPDQKGALFEPHHNTYDIEFWGPDGMCSTIYLGALRAMEEMARALGRDKDAGVCAALAAKSSAFLEKELYNGDYFVQKVMVDGLRNKTLSELIAKVGPDSTEEHKLIKAEGPKYQYKSGCLSDGVIGAWMAAIYGLEIPLDRRKIRRHLASVHKNNFRKNLSGFANTQRPGYALGKEPGLILCTWPKGGKPTVPFIYSDEVWTGIEYQVASHLMEEGMVKEALDIVRGARSRYDGLSRNPFNEYECGSFYARAMASFALLNSYSGFRYSAVDRRLTLAPKTQTRPFRTFFSTASGYGTLLLAKKSLTIQLLEGDLKVRSLDLTQGTRKTKKDLDLTAVAGQDFSIALL